MINALEFIHLVGDIGILVFALVAFMNLNLVKEVIELNTEVIKRMMDKHNEDMDNKDY